MKIAFFDSKSYDEESFSKYQNKDFEFKFYDTRLNKDTVYLANGFDAVCVFVNDEVNKEVIDKLVEYNIKLVLLRCAGYNNINLSYAYGRVHVMRVPAYSPYAVAEHTMALLLTSIRRIHKAYNRTREHNFSLEGLTGFDLHDKTIGIIGTGKIGKVFINICLGFGMKVLAYDKYPTEIENVKNVELNELLEQSDVISLHCPLTEESYHMINEESINRMKKGVIILNTSRGGLIDAEALLKALKNRKVSAACLDVYEEESNIFFKDYSGHIVNDDIITQLISLPNVIVTSHQAFLTKEALDNIAKTTIENVNTFIKQGYGDNELCYGCGNIENCIKQRQRKCF